MILPMERICPIMQLYFFTKKSRIFFSVMLSFHPFRIPQLVKGFVRMRELGIPVEINDYENLKKLLKCEDYIGIVEEHGDIVHKCGNRGDVFDYRHLPMRNSIGFIKKITWKPIKHNQKYLPEKFR